MLKKHIYAISLAFTLLILKPLAAENFIFDLGGVLIDTDPIASLRYIGAKNITQCMISLKKGPFTLNTHLRAKLFDTLELIATIHGYDSSTIPAAFDEHGTKLPYFVHVWLNGTMTCQEIRTITLPTIESNPEWFSTMAEKRAIINLITTIFTPEHFVTTRKLYKEGISFINACKKQGHKVYVLSNWDQESFELLKEKYADLFDLFDGIIISGECDALKPSATIYQTLLNRYELNPKRCWFIDDQMENIAAAQELGINAVLCTHTWPRKKPNFKYVAQTIKQRTNHKSVTRRENRNNNGMSANNTRNISSPIIDGEKMS